VKLNDEIQSLLQRADALQSQLQTHRDWQQASVQEALNIEYTYDSNRIEGNTLTLRETELVIHKGLTIAGKPMVEHLEALNHYEAIALIREVAQNQLTLNQGLLMQLHALILRGIDKEHAGCFRKVPVMISGSRHTPPAAWQLDTCMAAYFDFYITQKEKLHPLILAAEMHERLVTIHPFIDGNGRTARLVMNLILLQTGFPIAIISGDVETRLAYYSALEKCNIEQDKQAFYGFIIQHVMDSLQRLLNLVQKGT